MGLKQLIQISVLAMESACVLLLISYVGVVNNSPFKVSIFNKVY